MPVKTRLVFLALAALAPTGAFAQAFAGPEFRLSASTTTNNTDPRLAMTPRGDFVVSWSAQGGYDNGVSVRRFDATGAPVAPEGILTPDFGDGRSGSHDIAVDRAGNFVVAWVNDGRDGSSRGVFARRFDAAGTPLGADFQVNTYTTGSQGDFFPGSIGVARTPDGRFVVVWEGTPTIASQRDIFGQRYDAAGTPLGGEFRVNTYLTNAQYRPNVATDDAGNFVVVWSSDGQDGSFSGVFGQRFAASGAAQGGEFQVNTYTTGYQGGSQFAEAVVGRGPGGAFIVAWSDPNRQALLAQRYDASGTPAGGEFQVNGGTAPPGARAPVVKGDARGNFVVSWMSGTSYYGSLAFARRYASDGTPRGPAFAAFDGATSLAPHRGPVLGSDDVGNFAVVWNNVNPTFGRQVRGQRFGGLFPESLAVDTVPASSNGNGILEPGEGTDVVPTWRNRSGASQTFGGVLSAFTGPGNPGGYGVVDSSGNYGPVADGAAAACGTPCYSIALSPQSPRPAVHWDDTVIETITPDEQGQQKQWTLHVGNSFTDVSTTSPFYRFVETLLHRGVTSGCNATQYCPSTATTRDQMAVFVLVARQGTGFSPQACGATPMFADVPVSSPFCRWIEELARRGVVGGCGAGNYCPSSSVTRAQMPIFVLRTLDPALNPPACTTPLFVDVPATDPFCRWIEELARRGVVTGCGGGAYCPNAAVTREQMGVFLGVTFGLTLYGP